jgi:hypothetical protein
LNTVKTRADLLRLLPKGIVMAELGVFVGDFSKEIIDIVKPSRFFMVDLFEEGQCYSGDKDGENPITVPDLSVYFKELSERYKDNLDVWVVRGKTVDFLHECGALDAVYIDASHLYKDVLADLFGSYSKISEGFILGHDYNDIEVRTAVHVFCGATCLKINVLTEDKCPSYLIKV